MLRYISECSGALCSLAEEIKRIRQETVMAEKGCAHQGEGKRRKNISSGSIDEWIGCNIRVLSGCVEMGSGKPRCR